MIVIDSVENAMRHLSEGYVIAKVAGTYTGMTTECRVAGRSMGIRHDEWWFTLIQRHTGLVCGTVNKTLFVELYQYFYITGQDDHRDTGLGRYYVLNDFCPTQEFPRYKRKLDCWSDYTSKPGTSN